MDNKSMSFYIGEGVLRGFFLTLGLILIYAVFTVFFEASAGTRSACLIVITCLSVMYGAIYAAKKVRRKGWIIGLMVAVFYILIFYIVGVIAGREAALSIKDLFRTLLAVFVGILSGMLGVNI